MLRPTSGRAVSAAMACAAERRYLRTPEIPRVERRKTGLTSGCYERKTLEKIEFCYKLRKELFCVLYKSDRAAAVSSEDYQMLPKHAKYTAGFSVPSFHAYSIIELSVPLWIQCITDDKSLRILCVCPVNNKSELY